MKNIALLLSVITICHISAGDWNGGGAGWGHEDSDEVNPPWWPKSTMRPTTTSTTTRKPSKEELTATCIRRCPVTSEYNPVCGTNNVTYDNPGRLECAQRCGVDVQISRRARCNVEVTKNITRSSIESCVKNCPIPTNFLATCGTNNVTYASPERLKCVQGCGVAVSLDNYHPCYRYPNHEDSLTAIEYKVCHQVCSSNKEHRPICGTDGRDYKNHEHLHCARKCGINVNIRSENKCTEDPYRTTARPVIEPSTPKPEITTKPNEVTDVKVVMACMQQCPLTSECVPVCGTDGVTYRNPGRLLCSQFCGIDVKVKEFAACPFSKAFTNCPGQPKIDEVTEPPKVPVEVCLQSCPASTVYAPVCGSDGKTYNNVDDLICAKQCGVDVWLKKQSSCDDFVTPPTTTTEEYDIDIRAPINFEALEEKSPASIYSSTSLDKITINTDKIPASVENSSASTDNSPVNVENNSSSTDNSPINIENSSASTDNSTVDIKNSSASTDNSLIGVENSSSTTDSSTSIDNNLSTSTDSNSVTTDSPADTENSTPIALNTA